MLIRKTHMEKLMTDLFDLAFEEVYSEVVECEISSSDECFEAVAEYDYNTIRLVLYKNTRRINFWCNDRPLHINQYPLYERLSEYIERGV